MKKALEKLLLWIENAVVYFSIAGLMFMVVIVFYQVMGRYLFNRPPRWTEEIALIMMIWIAMLGAGVGLKNDIHMRVEVFMNVFPKSIQRLVEIAIMTLIGYFGIQMTRYTLIMIQRLPNRMPATGISVRWMYLPVAVCGILLVMCVVLKILEQIALSKGERKQ
ncbi:TRAP transporter small permease [Pseudothermotoga sp.]|uniref:TRAP transporter small permease n=1 Tax=Pseudothermotoga sp. TaxID=2033661 RepID=UPI0031F645DE